MNINFEKSDKKSSNEETSESQSGSSSSSISGPESSQYSAKDKTNFRKIANTFAAVNRMMTDKTGTTTPIRDKEFNQRRYESRNNSSSKHNEPWRDAFANYVLQASNERRIVDSPRSQRASSKALNKKKKNKQQNTAIFSSDDERIKWQANGSGRLNSDRNRVGKISFTPRLSHSNNGSKQEKRSHRSTQPMKRSSKSP